jgi:hypothetical protein
MLSMVIGAGQCNPSVSDRGSSNYLSVVQSKKEKLMSSGKSERFASSRGTAAMILAGMLVLGLGLTARAQSADDGSNNDLEGTWRAQVTVRDCQTGVALRAFPATFAFAKGGTVTFTTAGQLPSLATPGLGAWHHMDGHTYTAVSEVFIFSTAGAWIQTHRFTRFIEVSRDANKFTDAIGLEIFNTDGNLIATGCGTTVANRLK